MLLHSSSQCFPSCPFALLKEAGGWSHPGSGARSRPQLLEASGSMMARKPK